MARTTAPLLARMSAATLAVTLFAAPAWSQQTFSDRDRAPKSETEGQAPPAPSGNLSDQLDRSKGVVRPHAGVAPQMQVPPPRPDSQRTPVIPPPGSPGGDQSVEPK